MNSELYQKNFEVIQEFLNHYKLRSEHQCVHCFNANKIVYSSKNINVTSIDCKCVIDMCNGKFNIISDKITPDLYYTEFNLLYQKFGFSFTSNRLTIYGVGEKIGEYQLDIYL